MVITSGMIIMLTKKMSQSKSTKVVWKSKRQPLKLCL